MFSSQHVRFNQDMLEENINNLRKRKLGRLITDRACFSRSITELRMDHKEMVDIFLDPTTAEDERLQCLLLIESIERDIKSDIHKLEAVRQILRAQEA